MPRPFQKERNRNVCPFACQNMFEEQDAPLKRRSRSSRWETCRGNVIYPQCASSAARPGCTGAVLRTKRVPQL
ncbi:hypothetical protein NDU88_010491 [Pleurodeles waltl]|uniref:Uncharacterized protein n=1 Tax=Pleurodeles waltl TaxID=8319 RepID=A0AAV7S1F6_PLEWA|nr:hypothetical protein NDU88_010491 [Pleurodeles waltl]